MLKALTRTMMRKKVLMSVAEHESGTVTAMQYDAYRLQECVDSSNDFLKFDFLFQASLTARTYTPLLVMLLHVCSCSIAVLIS